MKATKLKELRKSKGLTLDELALLVGTCFLKTLLQIFKIAHDFSPFKIISPQYDSQSHQAVHLS